jgi:hypothetical protein
MRMEQAGQRQTSLTRRTKQSGSTRSGRSRRDRKSKRSRIEEFRREIGEVVVKKKKHY